MLSLFGYNDSSPMNIHDALHWRYAAKKLDPNRKVPEEKVQRIVDAVRFSPSANNFQPWKVVVVSDKNFQQKLQKACEDQEKVGQASHVLVLAALKKQDLSYADTLVAAHVTQRKSDEAEQAKLRSRYERILKKPPEVFFQWTKQQAFIALGFLLLTAAAEEVDAGPMAGFDPEEVDRLVGLAGGSYSSVAVVALGYRSPEDHVARLPKVRLSEEQVVEHKAS